MQEPNFSFFQQVNSTNYILVVSSKKLKPVIKRSTVIFHFPLTQKVPERLF